MINLAKCLEFRDETWRSKQLNQDTDFPEEYLPLSMQRTAFFGKKNQRLLLSFSLISI